jgi:hypothetical protein
MFYVWELLSNDMLFWVGNALGMGIYREVGVDPYLSAIANFMKGKFKT